MTGNRPGKALICGHEWLSANSECSPLGRYIADLEIEMRPGSSAVRFCSTLPPRLRSAIEDNEPVADDGELRSFPVAAGVYLNAIPGDLGTIAWVKEKRTVGARLQAVK